IDYYKSVQAKMGGTSSFYRLFMAPGMLHCAGGPGPNVLATLPAIPQWVAQNKAPDVLIATKYQSNDPLKSAEGVRPLGAFPAKALGTGDNPENYRCVPPKAGR